MSTRGHYPVAACQPLNAQGEPATEMDCGITIREHFAGLAMQGLLADHKDHSDERADGETCPQTTARLAVEHADALLAQLEKGV